MITMFIQVVMTVFYLLLMLVCLVMTLWLNVFSIPIHVLLCVFCALIRVKKPKLKRYGLMLYPAWSSKPGKTYLDTWNWYFKKTTKKKRDTFVVSGAWEERFFR